MANKKTPAPREGTVTDADYRLDVLGCLAKEALERVATLEQDKNDLIVACQALEQRAQTQEQALTQLLERVAVLEARPAARNGSNGASQAGLAPVVGDPQAAHTCEVIGRDEQAHGEVSLNRHGHCPKCFADAVYRKSQNR